MFNLGLPEMLVIGAAALLLFGPKRLPELAKGLGKSVRDFKKALDGEDEKTTEQLPPANSQAHMTSPTTPSATKVETGGQDGSGTGKPPTQS